MVNNRICDEIGRIAQNLRSLGRDRKWTSCSDGGGEDCGTSTDGHACLLRLDGDSLLMCRGGWKFMTDAASGILLPSILRRLREEASSLVLPDKTLVSLEHHISQVAKLLGSSLDSDPESGMSLRVSDVEEIRRRYESVAVFEPGMLEEDEISMVLRAAENWTAQIRAAYESINRVRRKNLHEDAVFWKNLCARLECIRDLRESRALDFVRQTLRCSNSILVAATLDSLLCSEKYLELGRAFVAFYGSLDLSAIYSSDTMDEFRESTIQAVRAASECIRAQPRVLQRSVLIHMENLADLIVQRVRTCDLQKNLDCCEELLSECVRSFLLLSECDCNAEDADPHIFRGTELLSRFHTEFADMRKMLVFSSSFRRIVDVVDADEEYLMLLREIEQETSRIEEEFRLHGRWTGQHSVGMLVNRHEVFASDVFNSLDTDRWSSCAIPALGAVLGQESERFGRLFGLMSMFAPFLEFDVFSERTLERRLEIVACLNKTFSRLQPAETDICSKILELFSALDLFEEVDCVFNLFFRSRDNEIVQLSAFRRRHVHVRNAVAYEVAAWCSSVPEADFMEEPAMCLSVHDGAGRIEVSLDGILFEKLDEYLVISSFPAAGSLIPQSVHGRMRCLAELRGMHSALHGGCALLSRVLKDVSEDTMLFENELDMVFGSVKELWNLKWRFLKKSSVDEFLARAKHLEAKVYSYRFLTKKIARTEMRRIFSAQIQREEAGFSTDPDFYPRFFELYDRDVVMRSIDRCMEHVFAQYLDSVAHALETGCCELFVSRHVLRTDQMGKAQIEPPLLEYFKVLEKIFPSGDKYFFDCVFEKFKPGSRTRVRLEKIMEMVVHKYTFCKDTLACLEVQELSSNLHERFARARDVHRSTERIVRNEIPFFVFEHSITTSGSLETLFAVCEEIYGFVDRENERVYNMLVNESRERPSQQRSVGFIQRGKSGPSVDIELSAVSASLASSEYLNSDRYRLLMELNEIVLENCLKRPRTSMDMVESERDAVLEWNGLVVEMFLANIPFESVRVERMGMLEAIEAFSSKIDGVAGEEDEFVFQSMFKSLKKESAEIGERARRFNRVLNLMDFPPVPDEIEDKMNRLDVEWSRFSRLSSVLVSYETQSLKELDAAEFGEFLESIDAGECNTAFYRLFLDRIGHFRMLLVYLEEIQRCYVLEKHLDRTASLRAFSVSFDEAGLKKRLWSSKMEYEVGRYVERMRRDVGSIRLETSDWMVANLGEIEARLCGFLVEHGSVVRFNTELFFSDDVDEVGKSISEYSDMLERIGSVQREIAGFANVFSSSSLTFEHEKYNLIRKTYSEAISDKKSLCGMRLADTPSLRPVLDEMDRDLGEVSRGLRLFLDTCREEAPRLFFVSDGDVVRALNDRGYYPEVLKLVFNIDDILMEDESVIGIVSGGESLMLRESVSASLEIKDFLALFENALRSTLEMHFLDGLKQESDGCPSVISDLISEFRYFNEKRIASTWRLRSLEREVERHSEGVLSLYPKPMLRDGQLCMDAVSVAPYGFEYYPPSDMVFTSLTSRIFSMISVSLLHLSGLILYGRSGTGKTESVRYYCRSVGRPVFVFCCNADCDMETLRRIIRGAVLTGSYVCFDEFNRLSECVMSSATEMILENRERTRFFLTMNIGYKGRHALPRSLRAVFGEIRVDVPDTREIIEYHCGDMSGKIHGVMSRLESVASKQEHYDFGLRAFRAIVRNMKDGEDAVVRSMVYFYMSSLLGSDRLLFRSELRSAFSGSDLSWVAETTHLDMLSHGLDVRCGALVVGDACTGKSSLIRALSERRKAFCLYYNPTNMSSLFGCIDSVTGEWRDSCFVRDLRSNMDARGEVWFVFDSNVESWWIEDFNSILDDNRLLCLSSGERIRIPRHYRFLFECDSLQNATPATLTRVFLLCMETDGVESRKPVCEDVSYNGERVASFPFINLIPTEEMSFYALAIANLARDRRVLFVKGVSGVGKSSLVSEVFGSRVVRISGRGLNGPGFRRLVDKDARRVRGGDVYDLETVFYIEEFDGGHELTELVREFNEYGMVDSLALQNATVVCGVDLDRDSSNAICERLARKTSSVLVEPPRDPSFVFGEAVRRALSISRHFHDSGRISQVLLFMHRSLRLSPRRAFEFIRTFRDLCTDEHPVADLLYFEAVVHFGESEAVRSEIQRVFGSQPACIGFDLKSRMLRRMEKLDEMSVVGSVLHRGYNLVIEGPRMSGKHWIVNECMRSLRMDVRVVDETDEKRIDEQTVFLVESSSVLEKSIVDRCLVFRLKRPPFYSLDLLKIHNRVVEGTDDWRGVLEACLVPEIGVDIDCRVPRGANPLVSSMEEGGHPPCCEHPNVVTVRSFYKFIDFGRTFIEVVLEQRKRQERRRTFLCDGLRRIEEFRSEAHALGAESAEKKRSLETLTAELSGKLQEIVHEQGLVERERSVVDAKRSEVDRTLQLSLEKRRIIDAELECVGQLIQESLRSVGEISKSHLSEIKALAKPPEIIKNTVEAVFYMIEGDTTRRQRAEWRRLIQFMKNEDFISKVLNCGDIEISEALELLVNDGSFTYEKAQNASKACGPLFRWVMAKYRYTRVLQEMRPLEEENKVLEEEIERGRADMRREEGELRRLEERIWGMKQEYGELSAGLESIRLEILSIDRKAEMINRTVQRLSDETEKWRWMEYVCPMRQMLTTTDWMLRHGKNVAVHDAAEIPGAGGFISTSLRDRNYRQVLSNCSHYGNSVVVNDCNELDRDVYKLLKHQAANRSYSVVLVSETDVYESYTYRCRETRCFEDEEDGVLERLETELLELMVSHDSLEDVCRQKDLLEAERELRRQSSVKVAVHEMLNSAFLLEDRRFSETYGMGLSFDVYREYVEKELYPVLEREFSGKLWSCLMNADMDAVEEMISKCVASFYSRSFPGHGNSCVDVVEEMARFGFDYTVVSAFDDLAFVIEERMDITAAVSAGSVEANERIRGMLLEESGEQRTYLVKNIHLLEGLSKSGNRRFVFTMENREKHALMRGTRVVYHGADGDYEAIRRNLAAATGADNELVDFHARMVADGHEFYMRDLVVCLKSREHCSSEYLKSIVYYSRINK